MKTSALFLMLLPAVSFAQGAAALAPAPAPAPAAAAAAPATGGGNAAGAKKKKVIRLDAITVEGRIQKPQAFYILQRSTLNFDELNRAETFIPQVEKSVDKTGF